MIDFDRYVEQAKSYGEWPGGHVDMSSGRIDGLSYRLYRHTAESEDVILVYHGGGVNSAAGYDVLARQLAAEPTLAVCLVDIRGHGDSTGERGTVERPERIWRDVDIILAEMRRRFPLARRHLLGHSSGAGMLLNYLTRYPGEQQANSRRTA
ncbi:alpha/beta fold hydrolase [Serratia bockelmannii]|uniref:alpha/beta hydrolase n=1 Tax=Serratia bockelmannii TaxID=2703793 RepID=UPI00313DCFAC